jgi:hypothetical protein
LTAFSEENNIIKDNQSGFRKDRRTSDNLFILKCVINKYLNISKKKLHLCFIDFSKAFDNVWRDGLLLKLQRQGFGGKFYNMIKSMYRPYQTALKYGNGLTSTFTSNKGVKQGDNLSPSLFNIFLNDLSFSQLTCDPIQLHQEQLSHLLWADDLLLLSQSAEGLQNCLNTLNKFCSTWYLTINIEKSKVMIITKSTKTKLDRKFYCGDNELDQTQEYTYLGCTINSRGNFASTKTNLSNKALKALFKINSSFQGSSPPPVIYNKLFDTLVKPIVLYNCEI